MIRYMSSRRKAMADNARQKSKKYKMISNGNARKRQSRTKKTKKERAIKGKK